VVNTLFGLIPVAALFKSWVCDYSLAEIVYSNPIRAWLLSLVSFMCCQVEVSATGRSLVQKSPTAYICVALSVLNCNS